MPDHRGLVRIFAGLVALLSPGAAFAQAGLVTTAPTGLAAPAMSTTLLVLLSLVLAVLAFSVLRRTSAQKTAVVSFVAILAAAAGIGYAVPQDVVVENDECTVEFTHQYNPEYGPRHLVSDCPNPIQIVRLEVDCDELESSTDIGHTNGLALCVVGQTLQDGDVCVLPDCRL